jgi:hypothetical protein
MNAQQVLANHGAAAPLRCLIINTNAIGQRCGYGEGETREEAVANALVEAWSRGYTGARYNPSTDSVEFCGEVRI